MNSESFKEIGPGILCAFSLFNHVYDCNKQILGEHLCMSIRIPFIKTSFGYMSVIERDADILNEISIEFQDNSPSFLTNLWPYDSIEKIVLRGDEYFQLEWTGLELFALNNTSKSTKYREKENKTRNKTISLKFVKFPLAHCLTRLSVEVHLPKIFSGTYPQLLRKDVTIFHNFRRENIILKTLSKDLYIPFQSYCFSSFSKEIKTNESNLITHEFKIGGNRKIIGFMFGCYLEGAQRKWNFVPVVNLQIWVGNDLFVDENEAEILRQMRKNNRKIDLDNPIYDWTLDTLTTYISTERLTDTLRFNITFKNQKNIGEGIPFIILRQRDSFMINKYSGILYYDTP